MQKDFGTTQVRIITINVGEGLATVKQYARNNSCLFLMDATGSTWSAYAQRGYIPLNYVLRADNSQTIYNWMEGFSETQIRNWINACLPAVEEREQVTKYKLEIYPNPFTESVVIKWAETGEQKNITANVHDLTGRLVKVLTSPWHWDGQGSNGVKVTEGVYFLKISDGETTLTEKLIKLK